MKKPYDIFNWMKTLDYHTSGDSVDWWTGVSYEEKRIYFCFEGSKQKRDWLNNFRFPVKPYKNQQSCLLLSRGWADAWKSCNDVLIPEVFFHMRHYPTYEVVVCGHSLGGAMAICAAEDLYYQLKVKPVLITFGAPKPVFGRKSAEYLKSICKEIHQYGNHNDIVTYCPPLPGYRHLNLKRFGEKFSPLKIFKPYTYHCNYGDENLYKES